MAREINISNNFISMLRKSLLLLFNTLFSIYAYCQTGGDDLKVVLIRHAEKPAKGYNLTCQGVNRSRQLPDVLYSRFGIPVATYIPRLDQGDTTKHARMFQTIVPFASKYNLIIDSKYEEDDSTGLAKEIGDKKGTVLVVWEHKRIISIARALGVKDERLHWSDEDYDSIWIVTFHNGAATLTKEKEGLKPDAACAF
jgi:hypothetical protein